MTVFPAMPLLIAVVVLHENSRKASNGCVIRHTAWRWDYPTLVDLRRDGEELLFYHYAKIANS